MVMNPVRLLYFSPTGTTRKVLEAMQKVLGWTSRNTSTSHQPGQERDGAEKYRAA